MKIEKILRDIEKGVLQVHWKGWSFAGGHTYGNKHKYDILKEGKKIYEFALDEYSLDIYAPDVKHICSEFDEIIIEEADMVLFYAVKRDDKELVRALTEAGTSALPADYKDISREEVMNGSWIKEV